MLNYDICFRLFFTLTYILKIFLGISCFDLPFNLPDGIYFRVQIACICNPKPKPIPFLRLCVIFCTEYVCFMPSRILESYLADRVAAPSQDRCTLSLYIYIYLVRRMGPVCVVSPPANRSEELTATD